MSDASPTTNDVIASALSLPIEDRLVVLDAIHNSLADPSVDHGPEEPATEVQAAWREEIARRLDDLRQGKVTTIPAKDAERMIRGNVPPTI